MKKFKRITELPSNHVFVFGSNLLGVHGAGAALDARKYFNAKPGNPEGPQGQAYAIPTKDTHFNALSLYEISKGVERFLSYAYAHPSTIFYVTPIGTGLAGYTLADIAPFFDQKTENVRLSWV